MSTLSLETRFSAAEIAIATDASGHAHMTGVAAPFNSLSHEIPHPRFGSFIEKIDPGAFKRSLKAGGNVFVRWEHDGSQPPLGSVHGGKLALEEDRSGLTYSLDASRMTPPQLAAVQDGDMRVSIGFFCPDEDCSWAEVGGQAVRTLHHVDLREISLVTSPAYEDTSAAIRSYEEWRATEDKPYGNIAYADPKNGKYPVDTVEHIKAAWSYIHMPKNQKEYSAAEVEEIKDKIVAAWKKKIDSKGPPGAEDESKEPVSEGMEAKNLQQTMYVRYMNHVLKHRP